MTLSSSTFHRPYPPHTQKKLWKSQKKLQNIELFPSNAVDEQYSPNVEDTVTNLGTILQGLSFEHLKAIRIIPDGPSTALLCSIALQKGVPRAIDVLEVDGRQWNDVDDFKHQIVPNTTKDQLVESLFAHVPRMGFRQKGNLDHLTALTLKHLDLAQSKYTWETYLSLGRLTQLEIHYCEGADAFLMNLTKGDEASDPALTTLHAVHDPDEGIPDRTREAIDHLLNDIQAGMIDLKLCLRGLTELSDVAAIAKHGGSLRKLFLDCLSRYDGWQCEFPYEEEDLKTLLQPCSLLEELAISFPRVSLQYETADLGSKGFVRHMRVIAECCHQLKVLSIIQLPSDYDDDRVPGSIAQKDRSLHCLAAEIFRITESVDDRDPTCHIQPLEVVAFGTRDRFLNPALAPRFFVPCVHKALNKTTRGSAQVKQSDLRKHGLSAGILEYERRDWVLDSRRTFYPVEQEDQDDDPGLYDNNIW